MSARADLIDPEEAHEHLESDPDTLLVCAYNDANKYAQNHLEGAISLDEFAARAATLPKDREIIFYCA